jgi:hypothetical protein
MAVTAWGVSVSVDCGQRRAVAACCSSGWAHWRRGRGLDALEPEQGGDAAGAEAWELAQDLLELPGVGGGDAQQHVVFAGDGVGAQDVRHGGERAGESRVVWVGVLAERDENEGLDAQPDLLVVDVGAPTGEHTACPQPLDAA